ncbi:MAG: dihydropteroate synthase [Deltaproteobacteria bacterium]|jgi:dihydropteroate synthase|nr:dihydropteroate synthase [Deltaproteobacteria bacterium]
MSPTTDPNSQALPTVLTWTTVDGSVKSLNFAAPIVMGVINVTPDSFSDGGRFFRAEDAIAEGLKQIHEGADILDVGGETTRPGSLPTPADEEWRRLEPVIKGLTAIPNCPPISVDANKAEIAAKALQAGAAIINDIWAGRKDPEIIPLCARYGVPIILMHMLGDPRTMQIDPYYEDVVREVREFLAERALVAEKAGLPREKIILDPGLGFGKLASHNLSLLKNLDQVYPPGYHTLMALSRKAFLGHILEGAPPDQRDVATAAANALAVAKGAEIIRVHAVKPSKDAARVAMATRKAA